MLLENLLGLFVAMFVVCIIPGPAVFAVISLSLTSGFKRGVYLTIGFILADFIFIFLAVSGLSALVKTMGDLFIFVRYACAAYLIWLGVRLFLHKPQTLEIETTNNNSAKSDILTGFFITLSNPKAILFYVALFPAFVDISSVGITDIGVIMLLVTFVIAVVNLFYAYMAAKAGAALKSPRANGYINKVAGSAMLASAALVAAKA